MSNEAHPVRRSGLLLGFIALLGTVLLTAVNGLTRDRIEAQERSRLLKQVNAVVPADTFDNDLLADRIEIENPAFFLHPAPVTVYRARRAGHPAAVVMTITAPDGYNGDIRLLVGIETDGTVLGVRVISHKETPGLGDPIEVEKSDWILGFSGKSLENPRPGGWAVKSDGGEFDQFTGATVSPRAVVRAVHRGLRYFEMNRQRLFSMPAISEEEP